MELKDRIKRAWWLFFTANLTFAELLNVFCNKCIYGLTWLYYAFRAIKGRGQLGMISGYSKYMPKTVEPAKRKRALMAYLPKAFYKEYFIGRLRYYFSNNGALLNIAQALNELGFEVDVIDGDNENFKIKKSYDLLFCIKPETLKVYQRLLPKQTTVILFAVVAYWRVALAKLQKRYEAFNHRHHLQATAGELVNYQKVLTRGKETDDIIASANGIVVMGDQLVNSYSGFSKVHRVGSAASVDHSYKKDLSPEKLHRNRNNFLFFGGSLDNIRKGLDLLLENFIGSPNHLYVCSPIQPFLETAYEISKAPNIHLMGYTKLNTKKFYKIIENCDFVIHPACAEGIPGGVLETMKYGLIPIVSRECNLETDDFGWFLPDYSIEAIKKAVATVTNWSGEELSLKAHRSVSVVQVRYSSRAFMESLKTAIIATERSKRKL